MKIAFSPCPNDTFVFHALVHGLIPGAPQLDVTYADIDITNRWATRSDGPDIMKISYAALPWVHPDYALIPCGGALGRGCGPLVLVRPGEGADSSDHRSGSGRGSGDGTAGDEAASGGEAGSGAAGSGSTTAAQRLSGKRVAVPSDRSTAYLLFRLWAADHVPGGVGEIVVLPFHEIMPAVRDGAVDAGLVIHEARFTYPAFGLEQAVDLGEWWEADTGLPIPLGAIIARRSLDLPALTRRIAESVRYAWAHPEASRAYVMHHAQELSPEVAQELSPEVAQAHIALYVNAFTAELGEDGFHAIDSLLGRAAREGLVPPVDLSSLRHGGAGGE